MKNCILDFLEMFFALMLMIRFSYFSFVDQCKLAEMYVIFILEVSNS